MQELPVTKQLEMKSFFFSAGLHAALLFFLLWEAPWNASKLTQIQPTLRVDLVGLPDQLKTDLASIPKELPKAVEPPPAQEIAPPPPPPPTADEMLAKPKVDKNKKPEVKKVDKQREKRMDSALAKIRSIEKLKQQAESEEENETIGAIVKGNKVSPGTSLSGEAKEAAEVSYFERVRDRVSEHWSLPPWLARQELSAQMLIQIDKQGRITRQKLVKSSGNPQFDEAITRALKDAQPLPTPPQALLADVSSKGILVGFPL